MPITVTTVEITVNENDAPLKAVFNPVEAALNAKPAPLANPDKIGPIEFNGVGFEFNGVGVGDSKV